MSKFLINLYENLVAYVPGEQPQDRSYLKLNTNESPFAPSPRIREAISGAEVDKLNLYSDPEAKQLVESIAARYDVGKDEVIVGNGSDELLAFIFRAFCDDKKGMACPSISYGFYPVFCALYGIKYRAVPLSENLRINVDDYIGITDNIIIANPNAQTGLALSAAEVERLVAQCSDRLLIVDEAYVDFGAESVLPLVRKYDNLIVVHTMSKSRNLAGARVGYAVAQKELIGDLNKIKYSFNPYNLNRLSIIAGTQAILDKEYSDRCISAIVEAREYARKELKGLGFFVSASMANFLLIGTERMGGKELYLKLKAKGVLVRFLSDKGLEKYVRVTIGTKQQMAQLICAIKEVLEVKI